MATDAVTLQSRQKTGNFGKTRTAENDKQPQETVNSRYTLPVDEFQIIGRDFRIQKSAFLRVA
jgi:hypothetical protein